MAMKTQSEAEETTKKEIIIKKFKPIRNEKEGKWAWLCMKVNTLSWDTPTLRIPPLNVMRGPSYGEASEDSEISGFPAS